MDRSLSETSGQHSEFVFVNGTPTYVVKYGPADLTAAECQSLFLVIPGNPGIIGFYEEFMAALHELSGRGIPVWGVSHAGHVTVPAHIDNSGASYNTYNLEGQIRHKVDFIRQYIPSSTRIVIVSHSIGAYMSLQLLKHIRQRNIPVKIEKVLLLFPTIKHMAETRHGRIASPLLKYLQWFAYLIVVMLSYLSPIMQYRMVLWYFTGRRVAECAYNASLNLFNPSCVHYCMYLAADELRQVLEPDYQFIQEHLHKLIFYYGVNDHWTPLSYYEEIKDLFPDSPRIQLCENNFEHAFVLESSREMAQIVWSWTSKELST